MKLLGALWAFVLYLGMNGMNFIFTAKPTEIWMICIACAPMFIWATWTYHLLTSKKEKTDDNPKQGHEHDAQADRRARS